jgi:hypothetical protein
MSIGKREAPPRMQVDLIAEDPDGRAILLGEVKAGKAGPEQVEQLRSYLEAANATIPYALLADFDQIRIYTWDGGHLSGPVFTAETTPILRHYAEDFGTVRIYKPYFVTLIEAWLRDLAYRWKSEEPPGAGPLTEIGLLPLLGRGTTRTEVTIGGYPIP